jgi:hypothetical protein
VSIKSDVDRGLEIDAEIERLTAERKEIEGRLIAAALQGEQLPLNDEEREGRQFLAKGSREFVPVVLTADLLMKSFQHASVQHIRVDGAACGKLEKFYSSKRTYHALFDNGKAFRKQADSFLGASAPAFISACLQRDKQGMPKSDIKVEWKRATEIL